MEKKLYKEWHVWWKGIRYISFRGTVRYLNSHSFSHKNGYAPWGMLTVSEKIRIFSTSIIYPFIFEEWVEK